MGAIFGGGAAARQAAEAKKMQQVANDRQLAELRGAESRDSTSRRNPRGRRLFVSNAAEKSNLS